VCSSDLLTEISTGLAVSHGGTRKKCLNNFLQKNMKPEFFHKVIKEKIEYLKDIFNLSYYVSTDNFKKLDNIFKKYKNNKFLIDPNIRIENNRTLIYFSTSLNMMKYLIDKGGNINTITSVDVTNNTDIYYVKKIYKSNFIYNSIFMTENFYDYYLLGVDFHISKKAIIKTIKNFNRISTNNNNYLENRDDNYYIRKLYIKLLNLSNKYIKKYKNKLKNLLENNNFNHDENFSIISYL